MGMVLACDIRLAVPATSFFYPVMKRGFLPQPRDSQRMRALIGPTRTKLILMAGQKLTAQQALQYGLIERVVEPDQLLTTALDFAADIAHGINALCCDRD
jgi:enoyl-CoA hydratase